MDDGDLDPEVVRILGQGHGRRTSWDRCPTPSTKEVGNTPQDPRTSTKSAHVKIDLAVEIQYPCLFGRADLSPVMRSAIVGN